MLNSKQEEEVGRLKGGGGRGRERDEKTLPSHLSFFCPTIYPKGCYFHSPQSSSVIKSKMAATTTII